MAKTEKLLVKLLNLSGSFTWNELAKLLGHLGYKQLEGAGSRVKFDNGDPSAMISLHRPHPGSDVKHYARKQIIEILRNVGVI
jgi:hypothetical protein